MFYRCLSRVEQLHIIEAFTFELGKCYEQAIKERELDTEPGPVDGRKVGIVADPGSDLAGVARLIKAITVAGAVPLLTAPVGGKLKSGRRTEIVERTLLTARSVEFDAVVIAAGTPPIRDIKLMTLLQEAFRHCKPVAAWGDGVASWSRPASPLTILGY
jgi:catalase